MGKGEPVIETLSDLKLTARALRSGWLNAAPEKKAAAVDAMLQIVEECPDPEMQVKAFEALVKADVADVRRMEVEIRHQEADDTKRLRLIEILGRLSPAELSKLTSSDTGDVEGGSPSSGQDTQGG